MISAVDKCLFVHIPKVAGQSIELAFLRRANLTWQQRESFLLRKNSDPTLGPPRLAHLTASEYLEFDYVTQENFNSLFKFSFVRNPWDRLVSEYLYRQYPVSFKSFVFDHFPTKVSDNYVKGFDGYRHVMPQYKFVYDKEGQLMVDFIGKFENLQQDFAEVSRKIVGSPLALPYKNKTTISADHWLSKITKSLMPARQKPEKKHFSEYYDTSLIQWVHDFYAEDIALFDYKFL
jgi:hypothetical protein